MKEFGKVLLIPLALILLAAVIWGVYAWEMPLMAVLPQENWVRVQARGCDTDLELAPILEAFQENKVSRADSPSNVLSSPYLELRLYSNPGTEPTLLYVQENGNVSFAAHMDMDHYRHYDGGQALYQALLALGVPVK